MPIICWYSNDNQMHQSKKGRQTTLGKNNNQVEEMEDSNLTALTRDPALRGLDLFLSPLLHALKSFTLYLKAYHTLASPFVINF